MRKNTGKISAILLAGAWVIYFSCRGTASRQNTKPAQQIEDTVLAQVDTFRHFITDTFLPAVSDGKTGEKDLQGLFLKARLQLKRFEWAAEYFAGATTQLVNGPPVQEVENADLLDPTLTVGLDPSGLQVIEAFLYPRYDTARKAEVTRQLHQLVSDCDIYASYFGNQSLSDWRILDAAKLEIFRIITLGITGFDAPLALNSLQESAVSLESLRQVLTTYSGANGDSALTGAITGAIRYLRTHTDFNAFDRAEFITGYANKISAGMARLEKQLNQPPVRYNRLLRQGARTLFDSDAFNVNAFAPGPEYFLTAQKAALGKRLFYDASLSGPGTRSCASCHQPNKSFTDGLAKNKAIHGTGSVARNTPTLINAALQSNLFYDMRALTLEDQVSDVIANKTEMGGSLMEVARRLQKNQTYRKLFKAAFPQNPKNTIDTFEVKNALASYVRSLTGLNSRFDEYMRGNKHALKPAEVNGFNLFMGKAKCGTCHYLPLFNGMVPPKYVVSDAEVIGVPASADDTIIDPDLGWYNIIGIASYKHAFKTPTLRNSGETAPYMHNGVYKTLEEVMQFYNNGGGAGMGIQISNQTLSADSLHLSETEIDNIISFIKSLDSSPS
jgi:cytochrome c peroxidase